MTSMNAAASQLGVAIGAAVGGIALQFFGWGIVGVVLGIIHLLAALFYQMGISTRDLGQDSVK